MERTILLVDDDPAITSVIARLFERKGWRVLRADTGAAAYARFVDEHPDVVLLDLNLPAIGGMELLEQFKREDPAAAVIMLTGSAEIELAVEAMNRGAENFLTKPLRLTHIEAVVERAQETVLLRRRNREMSGAGAVRGVTGSVAMRRVLAQIEQLAPTDSTVLLQGETGTGKGWTAQQLHSRSPRAQRALVDVNCAGLSATFLDSELFGHEKGAFTDARTEKRGLFEIAHGGTLFLDEVGELSPELQPKLLKVLETRRFRRLGGTKEIEVDVRLVAATNRDLAEDVKAGKFREDLYYRLAVFPIHLPPLRERGPEEIAGLCYTALAELRQRHGKRVSRISDGALELLARYRWPGNIRELRNLMERCLAECGDEETELQPRHVPPEVVPAPTRTVVEGGYEPELTLAEVERRHLERVLEHCGGNRTRAAKVLGISRRAIYDKLERYGLG